MTDQTSRGQHFVVDFLDRAFGGTRKTAIKVDGDNGGAVNIGTAANFEADTDYDAGVTFTVKATVAVAAKKAITITGILADNTDATKPPIGVSVLGATSGSQCAAVHWGVAKGVLTSATAGTRYYLSTTGDLTTTKPSVSTRAIVVMGYALTATDLFVQISDQGTVP